MGPYFSQGERWRRDKKIGFEEKREPGREGDRGRAPDRKEGWSSGVLGAKGEEER